MKEVGHKDGKTQNTKKPRRILRLVEVSKKYKLELNKKNNLIIFSGKEKIQEIEYIKEGSGLNRIFRSHHKQ